MWQWQQVLDLLGNRIVKTAVFYQEDFGTDYLKPTPSLLGGFKEVPESFSLERRPSFDDQPFYLGPLLPRTAKKQLVGWASAGFATTGTEQWPSLMCRWIAKTVLQSFAHWSTSPSVLAGWGDRALGQKGLPP
jgi:hypothetical protein